MQTQISVLYCPVSRQARVVRTGGRHGVARFQQLCNAIIFFSFWIVNFPYTDSNIPANLAYGVFMYLYW